MNPAFNPILVRQMLEAARSMHPTPITYPYLAAGFRGFAPGVNRIPQRRIAKTKSEMSFSTACALLVESVRKGDTQGMIRAFENGADKEFEPRFKTTLLHTCAERGPASCVLLLLENGAKPDERDEIGFTPLHFAATSASQEIISLFLDAGANPYLVLERTRENPITIAEFYRNKMALESFRDHGVVRWADPGYMDWGKRHPLYCP